MITMDIRKRHIVRTLRAAVLLLFVSAFFEPLREHDDPTGGPRDSLPPVIVNMTPDNFSINRPLVNHEKIYIEFDEFVQLKDQQKEFFTSPHMKKKPHGHPARTGGRHPVARHAGSEHDLLRSTSAAPSATTTRATRSIRCAMSFRRVLRSTRCSSRVIRPTAIRPTPCRRVSSGSFPADSVENVAEYDSTVFRSKPASIARAENNGIFIAQNLKPIPYRVYAVQDKNDNQMYDPAATRWASSKRPTTRPRCPISPCGTIRSAST